MRGVKLIEIVIAALILAGFGVSIAISIQPGPQKYPEAYDMLVTHK